MKLWFPILLSLGLLSLSAFSTNYAVKQTGGGNFTTIQACAYAAKPGDTCTVFANTAGGSTVYNEYVILYPGGGATSGTAGSPITYQVNPGDNVQMQGFNLYGRSYITIGGPA